MKKIIDSTASLLKVSRNMLILRGIILLLLGISMFYRPVFTMWYLTVAIGVLVLIDGAATLAASLKGRNRLRSIMITDAVFLIFLGFFAIISPMVMDMVWIMLIGVWEILTGLQGLFLREANDAPWLTAISGIISILIGIFFLAAPLIGLMSLSWVIALFLILAALTCFFSAWKLAKVSVVPEELEEL